MPKRHQTSEDRDLEAIRRRNDEDSGEMMVSTNQIPVFAPDGEDTAPHELVSLRMERDPAFRFLYERVTRLKHEDRHAQKTLANTILDAVQKKTEAPDNRVDAVESRIDKIDTALGITKWIIGFVIAAVLGSIVVLATKIFTWGYGSGELEIRMKHLERDIDSLKNRLDSRFNNDGRRFDAPDATLQQKVNP